eukprot:CAMPEP_0181237222 /NCGR_PEP_ID=MMETSP1096-20121128/38633_1 /TAXON_ID=156174 ORGANISM="Chrysochromulina ericina, Strain CCMP281" /NCGR_SAMPLE_ID=MMETSP1096 /ASSEMBLY_ACC=CAM_ASM_000453 /LENGTH=41 /DNA_ID= /DNA_START= /DNA_END= /DNA_ORIENTATION=
MVASAGSGLSTRRCTCSGFLKAAGAATAVAPLGSGCSSGCA